MSLPTQPATFGPYVLLSRIATGGMAEVYVARPQQSGAAVPRVAVKRLLPHLARDPSAIRMFLNEARITAQVNHPNVVRIFEIGAQSGEPFIAMELLEGASFAQLRQRAARHGRRVPIPITLRVLTEACRGLHAAHLATDRDGQPLGIVHRDFTPDNLHVGLEGGVKVLDFGIARAENVGAGTEPGMLKGKYFYMSPEMIAGQPLDHRADVFAAGVMLYEQLCGRRPFSGGNADEVMAKIVAGAPEPPTRFDPSVPGGLEEVCLKALARRPGERFQSLAELADALAALGPEGELASIAELSAYVASLPEPAPAAGVPPGLIQGDPSPGRREAPEPGAAQVSSSPAPRPGALRRCKGAFSRWRARLPGPGSLRGAIGGLPRRHLVAGLAVVGVVTLAWLAASLLIDARTAGARLAAAAATGDAEARLRALGGLAADEATDGQLESAASLLLEVAAFEPAGRLGGALAQRTPDSPEGHLLEARAATGLRQGRRAEQSLEQARAAAPSDARVELALAELRELQGRLGEAIEALERARELPGSPAGLEGRLGVLMARAGRLEDAERALTAALAQSFDPRVATELGLVLFQRDRPLRARGLLRRALRGDPESFEARYYLGAVLFRLGDAEGALEAYREAAARRPEDARPLVARCEALLALGRPAEARPLAEELTRRFPGEDPLECRPPPT